MPQPEHIVRVELPDPQRLDADILKYFAKCEEKLGLVPNVLRAYTANAAKFRTFTAFYNQLMLDEETCRLSKLEREMIAVVVSSANRCYYCLVAHGWAVRALSGDPQLGEMMVMPTAWPWRRRSSASPLRRIGGRGQRDDAFGDLRPERRECATAASCRAAGRRRPPASEPLLPAPDGGLALRRPPHDLAGAVPIGGQKHDPRSPDVLLQAVPIRHHRFQTDPVGGRNLDDNPLAHAPELARAQAKGNALTGMPPSFSSTSIRSGGMPAL